LQSINREDQTDEYRDMAIELKSVRAGSEEVHGQLASLKLRFSKASHNLVQAVEKYERVKSQLAESTQKGDASQARVRQLEDQIAETNYELEKSSKHSSTLDTELLETRDELEAVRKQVDFLQYNLDNANEHVETFRNTGSNLDESLASMKVDAVRYQRDAADQKNHLTEAMDQLQSAWDELSEASNKNFQFQKELDLIKAENDDLKEHKGNVTSQMQAVKDIFTKMQNKNMKLTRELERYQSPTKSPLSPFPGTSPTLLSGTLPFSP